MIKNRVFHSQTKKDNEIHRLEIHRKILRRLAFAFSFYLLGCTAQPTSGVLGGNGLNTLNFTKGFSSSSVNGQIQMSGALMFQSIAKELKTQGFELSDIEEIAASTEKKLAIAGSLAIESESSGSSLSLTSSKKRSKNPLSLAGGVVINSVSYGILTSEKSKKVKKDYKLLTKIANSAHKSLKTIKEEKSLASSLGDNVFEGAVSKITGSAIGLVDDFGVEADELNDVMKEVTGEFIETLKADGVLKSNADIAKKVISGLAQGATNIKMDNVTMTDAANPATLANSLAFDIYNEETGAELSKDNPEDFDILAGVILEGAVESMDDSVSDAIEAVMEVAVVVYNKPPEELASVVERLSDVYEEAGVEIPQEIDEYVTNDELIEEFVAEGVMTAEEAETLETLVEKAAEELVPVEEVVKDETAAEESIEEAVVEEAVEEVVMVEEVIPEFPSCLERFPFDVPDYVIQDEMLSIFMNENGAYTCKILSSDICPVSREYYNFSISWTAHDTYADVCNLNVIAYTDSYNPKLAVLHNFNFYVENYNMMDENYGYVGEEIRLAAYPYDYTEFYELKFFKSHDCSGLNLIALSGWQTKSDFYYTSSLDDVDKCLTFYVAARNDDGVDHHSADYGDGILGKSFRVYPLNEKGISYFHMYIEGGEYQYYYGRDDLGIDPYTHGAEARGVKSGSSIIVRSSVDMTNGLATFSYAIAELADCRLDGFNTVPNPVLTYSDSLSYTTLDHSGDGYFFTMEAPLVQGCYLVRGLAKSDKGYRNLLVGTEYWEAADYIILIVDDEPQARLNYIDVMRQSGTSYEWIGNGLPQTGDHKYILTTGQTLRFDARLYDHYMYYDQDNQPLTSMSIEYALYRVNCDKALTSRELLQGYQASPTFEYTISELDDNLNQCRYLEIEARTSAADYSTKSWNEYTEYIISKGSLPPSYNGTYTFSKDGSVYGNGWEILQSEQVFTVPGDTIYVRIDPTMITDPDGGALTVSMHYKTCDGQLREFTKTDDANFSITVPESRGCYHRIYLSLDDGDSDYYSVIAPFPTDMFREVYGFELPENYGPRGSVATTVAVNGGTPYTSTSSLPYLTVGDTVTLSFSGLFDPEGDAISYGVILEQYCQYSGTHHYPVDVQGHTQANYTFTITDQMRSPGCNDYVYPYVYATDSVEPNPYTHMKSDGTISHYDRHIGFGTLRIQREYSNPSHTALYKGRMSIDTYGFNNFAVGDTVDVNLSISEYDGDIPSYAVERKQTCGGESSSVGEYTQMTGTSPSFSAAASITVTQTDIDECAEFYIRFLDGDGVTAHPDGYDVRSHLVFALNEKKYNMNPVSLTDVNILKNGVDYVKGEALATDDVLTVSYQLSAPDASGYAQMYLYLDSRCDHDGDGVLEYNNRHYQTISTGLTGEVSLTLINDYSGSCEYLNLRLEGNYYYANTSYWVSITNDLSGNTANDAYLNSIYFYFENIGNRSVMTTDAAPITTDVAQLFRWNSPNIYGNGDSYRTLKYVMKKDCAGTVTESLVAEIDRYRSGIYAEVEADGCNATLDVYGLQNDMTNFSLGSFHFLGSIPVKTLP